MHRRPYPYIARKAPGYSGKNSRAWTRVRAATAAEDVDPPDDLHGDAAYRRGLVATLIERGLRAAAEQGSA
jgi:CO/xanthine dehydrogenase FAD-binding subunit